MAQKILNDSNFLLALKFAKGLARQSAASELTPLIMLCGFVIAGRDSQVIGDLDEIKLRAAEVQAEAEKVGLKLDGHVKPFEGGRLPTSASLREILKRPIESVSVLIDTLFQSINSKGENDKGRISIEVIKSEIGFSDIIGYARALAGSKNLKDISLEVLAAGAFFAFKKGLLKERPSIRAHLAANEANIVAMLQVQDWHEAIPNDGYGEIPLASSVEDIIKQSDDHIDPLMVALNGGITSAANILSKKRVAYHEAGHAVVSNVLRPDVRITQVTIISDEERGGDGCVAYDTTSPYYKRSWSRDDFLDEVCVALAGRVSEQRKYGHNQIDQGATTDLEGATSLVWDAITKYGLDFDFGPVSLPAFSKSAATSQGWLFDEAQKRLQEIMKECNQRSETVIAENWNKVEAVANVLFEKKKLTEDEVLTIMQGVPSIETQI